MLEVQAAQVASGITLDKKKQSIKNVELVAPKTAEATRDNALSWVCRFHHSRILSGICRIARTNIVFLLMMMSRHIGLACMLVARAGCRNMRPLGH